MPWRMTTRGMFKTTVSLRVRKGDLSHQCHRGKRKERKRTCVKEVKRETKNPEKRNLYRTK